MSNQLPNQATTSGNRANAFVREHGFDAAGDDALLRAASADIEQWAREYPDARFALRRLDDTHLILGFLLENWLLTCTVFIMEEGVCAKLSAFSNVFSNLPPGERVCVTLAVAAINSTLVRGCWSVAGENNTLTFTVPLMRRFTSQSSIEPLCAASLDLAFLSVVASVSGVDQILSHARSSALDGAES